MPAFITAALDMTSWPVGTPEPTEADVRLVELLIAPVWDNCEHGETVCPDCVDSWACDYELLDGPSWAMAVAR